MDIALDERYLNWLYRQVAPVRLRTPSRTYWSLFRKLFTTEFVWFIPNDDNRVEDGRDLRYEFFDEERIENADADWIDLGCSFLEMLLSLSRRLSFEGEGEPRDWFWHLLENLDLAKYNDGRAFEIERVGDILERVTFRTYLPDGKGGLFPLQNTKEDQRKVEIWYQLSAYLLERD